MLSWSSPTLDRSRRFCARETVVCCFSLSCLIIGMNYIKVLIDFERRGRKALEERRRGRERERKKRLARGNVPHSLSAVRIYDRTPVSTSRMPSITQHGPSVSLYTHKTLHLRKLEKGKYPGGRSSLPKNSSHDHRTTLEEKKKKKSHIRYCRSLRTVRRGDAEGDGHVVPSRTPVIISRVPHS